MGFIWFYKETCYLGGPTLHIMHIDSGIYIYHLSEEYWMSVYVSIMT